MKTKAKGTRTEAKVIELLEAIGFKCIRAAGSHGPFDLMAILHHVVFLIQVKTNEKPRPAEIEEMRSLKTGEMILKCYCVWKDRKKYPVFYFEWEW